jgi:phage major head subunit gpT-like protein
MTIVPSNLSAAFLQFSLLFNQGLSFAKPWSGAIAYEEMADGEAKTYSFLDKIPRLRKWLQGSPRAMQNAALRSYSLVHDDYELSVEVPRNKFEDDLYGNFGSLFSQMGAQAALWPDDLTAAALQAGAAATSICFDGQPFFNASHPVNMDDASKGTYSNLRSAAFALTPTNYATIYAEMEAYKGADGVPMQIKPSLLVVPPQLRQAAQQILNADFIAPAAAIGGNAAAVQQTNTLKGSADLLVVPQLANEATGWYLIGKEPSGVMKPIVFQRRKSPVLLPPNPDSEKARKERKYEFLCDARGAAGYTMPVFAYRCVG